MSLDIICTMVDADNVPVRGSIVLRQLDTGRRSEASVVIEAGSTGELADDGVYRLTERVLGLGEKVWTVDVVASDWVHTPVPYEDLPTAYGYDCATAVGRTYGAAVVHAAGCDCKVIDARLSALEAGGVGGGGVATTALESALKYLVEGVPVTWDASTQYKPHNVVLHDGKMWSAFNIAPHVGGVPGVDNNWFPLSVPMLVSGMTLAHLELDDARSAIHNLTHTLGVPVWDDAVAYTRSPESTVGHDSKWWRALADNVNREPGTDPAVWREVSVPSLERDVAAVAANLAAAIARVSSQEEVTNDLLKDTPSVYASASTYSSGDVVSYQGGLYLSVGASTGVEPGTDPAKWVSMAIPDLLAAIAAHGDHMIDSKNLKALVASATDWASFQTAIAAIGG